jgi:hypothetical protein
LAILCIGILLCGVFLPVSASSQVKNENPSDNTIRDSIAEALSGGKDVCAVVSELIRSGKNTTEIVNNTIVMGHPACEVVRCAIEVGGVLEDVIVGAFRAGATSDVIVTCCIEGGAEAEALARAIERLGLPGLGYTPPPAAPAYTPTFAPAIGGGGGGRGTVSPFRP